MLYPAGAAPEQAPAMETRPAAWQELPAMVCLALLEARPTAWAVVLAPMPARAPHSDSPQRVLNRQLKRGLPS